MNASVKKKNSTFNLEFKIINVKLLILCMKDLSGNKRVITNSIKEMQLTIKNKDGNMAI